MNRLRLLLSDLCEIRAMMTINGIAALLMCHVVYFSRLPGIREWWRVNVSWSPEEVRHALSPWLSYWLS